MKELLRTFAFLALFGVMLMTALSKPAHAYTDPGSGMMLVQLAASAAVGAMFYFRRFLGWFKGNNTKKDDPTE